MRWGIPAPAMWRRSWALLSDLFLFFFYFSRPATSPLLAHQQQIMPILLETVRGRVAPSSYALERCTYVFLLFF